MKERLTETYLFRDGDIARKRVGGHLSAEAYHKGDVIGAVEQSIIDKNLKKAVKVDNPKNNHIYYVFKMADEESKTTFRVGVPRKNYDENNPYVRSLNALKESGVNIKIANRAKLAATVGAVIIAGSLLLPPLGKAIITSIERQDAANAAKMERFFEDINAGRAENGLPPIDLVDENGIPYNSWEEYHQDQKELYEQENQEEFYEQEKGKSY